jgi:hypothetical protein
MNAAAVGQPPAALADAPRQLRANTAEEDVPMSTITTKDWHADLLQGLGQRAAHHVQSRLAAER